MQILLDTHVLIWFAEGIDKLSSKARSDIENLDNMRFVSIVSLWEIVIKTSLNKIDLKKSFNGIRKFLVDNDINLIPITTSHLNTLLNLPLHHKDPFDRLIIAQAITENLSIISADRHFNAYPLNVIW